MGQESTYCLCVKLMQAGQFFGIKALVDLAIKAVSIENKNSTWRLCSWEAVPDDPMQEMFPMEYLSAMYDIHSDLSPEGERLRKELFALTRAQFSRLIDHPQFRKGLEKFPIVAVEILISLRMVQFYSNI